MSSFGRFDGGLVAVLAAGASYVDAARKAGCSERTVRRRLADPAFRQQIADARAEMLAQAVARLTSASVRAVSTLESLLSSDLDFARLAAARSILELGLKLREHHDVLARLDAIEEQLKGSPPWRRTA